MVSYMKETFSGVKVAFFWHMHQPDYRDREGVMKMPWVFLHAIKDYYDMPWRMHTYKGVKATYNLTASLIEQLLLYDDPLKYDYFLALWSQPPAHLREEEKAFVVKLAQSTQYETMVKPFPRYQELYPKSDLSDAEMVDLEILFMLAWCGHYLRDHNAHVQRLIRQERHYSQEDKALLLEILTTFVQGILPFYRKLLHEGGISLTTTPYFHPILPLLMDMTNGQKANPHTVLPQGAFSLHEDANAQIGRSIALFERCFGTKPTGFWPAEGAVDESTLALYHEQGVAWIVTDEALLHRSLHNEDPTLKHHLYDFNGVKIVFRDRKLSDRIGFDYRYWEAHEASATFLHEIRHSVEGENDPTVLIVMDGENAWEYFPNGGEDFLRALYTQLSHTPWCSTVTIDEVLETSVARPLAQLASGTWINGAFDTWVGHPQKNRAWEVLFQTHKAVLEFEGELSPQVREKIQHHRLASECSDWFWWYGEDHSSDFLAEFDALFRGHLIEIYRLMGQKAPSYLEEPITA
ncbi:MAG: glycoside hydrolase family 57 protein [Sulfuricurvum sp.]